MPISGVLLACESEKLDAVRASVSGREASEVREIRDSCLIVVTDTPTMRADRDEVEALSKIDGVLSAHVVFSNVEDLAEPRTTPATAPAVS